MLTPKKEETDNHLHRKEDRRGVLLENKKIN